MKSLTFILALLSFSLMSAQTPVVQVSNVAAPEMTLTATEYDFGAVPKGEPVTHRFELTNTGSAPLIITEISKPCGCQKADWTRKAIAPGESGFVAATYNAAKPGAFVKSFTVKHNGNGGSTQLVLRGKVEKAAEKGVAEEIPG